MSSFQKAALVSASTGFSNVQFPFHLSSDCQPEAIWPLNGHVATSGDTSVCHNEGQDATGIYWVAAMNASKHPTVHRAASTMKNYPVQNVNRVEKSRFKAIYGYICKLAVNYFNPELVKCSTLFPTRTICSVMGAPRAIHSKCNF